MVKNCSRHIRVEMNIRTFYRWLCGQKIFFEILGLLVLRDHQFFWTMPGNIFRLYQFQVIGLWIIVRRYFRIYITLCVHVVGSGFTQHWLLCVMNSINKIDLGLWSETRDHGAIEIYLFRHFIFAISFPLTLDWETVSSSFFFIVTRDTITNHLEVVMFIVCTSFLRKRNEKQRESLTESLERRKLMKILEYFELVKNEPLTPATIKNFLENFSFLVRQEKIIFKKNFFTHFLDRCKYFEASICFGSWKKRRNFLWQRFSRRVGLKTPETWSISSHKPYCEWVKDSTWVSFDSITDSYLKRKNAVEPHQITRQCLLFSTRAINDSE